MTGPACSEAATGAMTGAMTAATGAMTGKTTAATGAMTGKTTAATGAMTGKTGVVAGPGCSGNREPDDQGGRTGFRCSCGAAATAFVADRLAPEAAASVSTGTVRVVLALPCWDDCLHTGLDDLIESASRSRMVLVPTCRHAVRAQVSVAVNTVPSAPAPLES